MKPNEFVENTIGENQNFTLPETHQTLRDLVRKFAEAEIAPVARQLVQIHGGYGLMEEYDVERFWRDHRLLRIGEGTSEIQRVIISRQIGCAG